MRSQDGLGTFMSWKAFLEAEQSGGAGRLIRRKLGDEPDEIPSPNRGSSAGRVLGW